MNYIDGFVTPVKSDQREAYRAHAARAAVALKALGATAVVECWGDDVPDGTLTSFPLAVQRAPDETVVFSWIGWPSRAARDAGWQRFMADTALMAELQPMPFDGKRMIHGGFQVLLQD